VYCFIVLLNVIGKIIKVILIKRISTVAETAYVLPNLQFRFRKKKAINIIIQVIINNVYTA